MANNQKADKFTISAADMAAFFGVTVKTICEWAKNGMPRVSTGTYHLKACFDWWQENLNKDTDDETLNAAKRKYWLAKAEKEHLSTQQLKGELIPRGQLVTDRVSRCLDMRKSLLALRVRLRGSCAHKPSEEIDKLVEIEVESLLRAFSTPSPLWPADEPEQKETKSKPKKPARKRRK